MKTLPLLLSPEKHFVVITLPNGLYTHRIALKANVTLTKIVACNIASALGKTPRSVRNDNGAHTIRLDARNSIRITDIGVTLDDALGSVATLGRINTKASPIDVAVDVGDASPAMAAEVALACSGVEEVCDTFNRECSNILHALRST